MNLSPKQGKEGVSRGKERNRKTTNAKMAGGIGRVGDVEHFLLSLRFIIFQFVVIFLPVHCRCPPSLSDMCFMGSLGLFVQPVERSAISSLVPSELRRPLLVSKHCPELLPGAPSRPKSKNKLGFAVGAPSAHRRLAQKHPKNKNGKIVGDLVGTWVALRKQDC